MAILNGVFNSYDLEAAKILDDFLPDEIFDAHAHLYDSSFVSGMANGGGAFSLRSQQRGQIRLLSAHCFRSGADGLCSAFA